MRWPTTTLWQRWATRRDEQQWLEWWRAELAVSMGFTTCAPREGKRTDDRGSWGNDRAQRKGFENMCDLAGDLLGVKNVGVTYAEQ
jgi:hypothetical protein